jgi:hypothetical protein
MTTEPPRVRDAGTALRWRGSDNPEACVSRPDFSEAKNGQGRHGLLFRSACSRWRGAEIGWFRRSKIVW